MEEKYLPVSDMNFLKDEIADFITRVFKNKSGVSGNLGGKASLKISRMLSDHEKKLEKNQEGFIDLEPVSEETVETIRSQFEQVIDGDDVEINETDGKVVRMLYGTYKNTDTFLEDIPETKKVIKKYDKAIKDYYGAPYRIAGIKLVRYPEHEEELYLDSTRSYHIDGFSPDTVRLFVFLTDVERTGGTSRFLDKESTEDALKYYRGAESGLIPEKHQKQLENYEKSDFYGEKGSSAIIFPAQHLHRATNPENLRDVLMITYQPSLLDREPEKTVEHLEYRKYFGLSSFIKTLKEAKIKLFNSNN